MVIQINTEGTISTHSLCKNSEKTDKENLLELINNYSKIAGCKINIQKSISSLYLSNEQFELEIKTTIPLILKSPQNEILRYKSNKICPRTIC